MAKRIGLGRGREALSARRLRFIGIAMLLSGFCLPISAHAGSRSPRHKTVSISMVVSALRGSGLGIEHLQRQSVGGTGGPGTAPATEREAWGFTLHGQRHGEGRILLFSSLGARDIKAAWYHRIGAHIVERGEVILWLDRELDTSVVARCDSAIARIGQ